MQNNAQRTTHNAQRTTFNFECFQRFVNFGLVLFFIVVFWGCTKDEDRIENIGFENKPTYTVKRITGKDIEKNVILNKKLREIVTLQKSNGNIQNRYQFNDELGFYIDTSEANYIELEDYHSYSFSIYRPGSSSKMENLLLSLKADGDYKAIIVSYNITDDELNSLNNSEMIDLNGKITLTSIDFENTGSLLQGRDIEFEGGLFFNSELGYCYNLEYETSPGTGWVIEVKEVVVTCPWDEPESIDAGPSTGGGGSGTGGSSGSGSSGGDGGTTGSGTGGSGPGGNNGGTSGGNTSDPGDNSDSETLCVRDSNGNCINDATAPLTPKMALNLITQYGIIETSHIGQWMLTTATFSELELIRDILDEDEFTNISPTDLIETIMTASGNLELYNIDAYPGMNQGYPFNWWNNDFFLEQNITFSLIEPYNRLTAMEKKLVKLFPVAALSILANKEPAENETEDRFGYSGRNDLSDAFRHAFFNAMNSNDVPDIVARLFSFAHETEVPTHLFLEVQMDLFNNNIGHTVGSNANIFVSDQELSNSVFSLMLEGSLLYLSPLDAVVFPNYGINASTQLTPSNQ
jgi:hypothetical protein